MKKEDRILHCVKRMAQLFRLIQEEFDDFCDASGYNDKEQEPKENENV